MTEADDGADALPTEHGITDEDMERIAAFLEMPQYERTVDDLRPLSKK